MGVVTAGQVILGQGLRPAQTLGHILAGHLQMDPAGMDALGLGHIDEPPHLAENPFEGAGLVAVAGLQRIAVHGVDRPDHPFALGLHRLHQARQSLADLVHAEATDQGQPAGRVVGIEHIDQTQQVLGLHGRTAFQADRVSDAARELDMGPVQLSRTLTDPDHMGGGVEPFAGPPVEAGQGTLEVQQQGLVAGEDLDPAQVRMALGRDPDGLHEGQGLGDLVGQLAVFVAIGAVGGEPHGPAMDVVEVGIAAAGEGPEQVQRRGRLIVGAQQALRVRDAFLRGEGHAVDDVAAIAGQFDAVDLLDRG